jgi:hypothetical protein
MQTTGLLALAARNPGCFWKMRMKADLNQFFLVLVTIMILFSAHSAIAMEFDPGKAEFSIQIGNLEIACREFALYAKRQRA